MKKNLKKRNSTGLLETEVIEINKKLIEKQQIRKHIRRKRRWIRTRTGIKNKNKRRNLT